MQLVFKNLLGVWLLAAVAVAAAGADDDRGASLPELSVDIPAAVPAPPSESGKEPVEPKGRRTQAAENTSPISKLKKVAFELLLGDPVEGQPPPSSERPEGAPEEPINLGPAGNQKPRVDFRYTTAGAGYHDNYTSVGGVLPMWRNKDGNRVAFFDARFLADDHAHLGGNFSLVERRAGTDGGVSGNYLSFDTRNTGLFQFNQLSFGSDELKENSESRLNVYLPVGTSRHDTGFAAGVPVMMGTQVVHTEERYAEAAMYGVDMEWLGRVPYSAFATNLWGGAGVYHYQAHGSHQVWGYKLRAELRTSDWSNLSIQFQQDTVFHWNTVFAAEFYFPGWRPQGESSGSALDRLLAPLRRTQTVTVDDQVRTIFQ